jgi:hypothetical protein
MATKLFLSHIPELDWLIALEHGTVDEGQPPENWLGLSEHFGYLLDRPGGRALGFKALNFSKFEIDCDEHAGIWSEPLFDAPTLALVGASAGTIIRTAMEAFGDQPSVNRMFFNLAVGASDPDDELQHWHSCLESGDCMAHYGLGIALLEQGVPDEAYRHLSFYATLAPMKGWAHHWVGRAALSCGMVEEARVALKRSIELETDEELMNRSRVLLVKLDG